MSRTVSRLVGRAALACTALATACDQSEPDRRGALPGEPAPRSSTGLAAADASADLPQVPDPPALAGDLATEIHDFTTLDACVDRRASLDPLVGDALEAIGYDTLLRDACRMLDAAKARDARRCDPIAISPMRDRCKALVAETAGTPDGCPWLVDSRQALGREPSCVALASRDPRLCSAVTETLPGTTCLAIARHDAAPCNRLAKAGDRARCARDVSRWGSLLPVPTGATARPLATQGKLTATSSQADGPIQADLGDEMREGVVAVLQNGTVHLTVGPLTDLDFAVSSATRTTLALALVVPRADAGSDAGVTTGRVERVELVLAGLATLHSPPNGSTLAVTLTKVAVARGGPLVMSVDGDITAHETSWHLHADLWTHPTIRQAPATSCCCTRRRTTARGRRCSARAVSASSSGKYGRCAKADLSTRRARSSA
jgi:hypothetical protein